MYHDVPRLYVHMAEVRLECFLLHGYRAQKSSFVRGHQCLRFHTLELWNTQSIFMHQSDPVFVRFLPLTYFAELTSFIKY